MFNDVRAVDHGTDRHRPPAAGTCDDARGEIYRAVNYEMPVLALEDDVLMTYF